MNDTEVLQIFTNLGVLRVGGHFVLQSEKHSSMYVDKDALYPHTEETSHLCCLIARWFDGFNVEVVMGPAFGGIVLSHWVAYYLSKMNCREVLSIYAEKSEQGKDFIITRGYDKLIAGKNVLVVEDVLTSGSSVKKVIGVTRAAGGNVVGLGALCNRGGVTTHDVADVPTVFSLVNTKLDKWDPHLCPLCERNIPINTDVGYGREFLARKAS